MGTTKKSSTSTTKSKKINSKVNKNIQVWLCAFLFGNWGVDRFTRKQPILGVLKLFVSVVLPFALIVIMGAGANITTEMNNEEVTNALTVYAEANSPIFLIFAIDLAISVVWRIVDFVVALVKAYGQAYGEESMFTFDKDGRYMK